MTATIYHMTTAVLDLWAPDPAHVFDIYRVSSKRGWFGYLKEDRLLVARLPNGYDRESRGAAEAMLAKFKAGAA